MRKKCGVRWSRTHQMSAQCGVRNRTPKTSVRVFTSLTYTTTIPSSFALWSKLACQTTVLFHPYCPVSTQPHQNCLAFWHAREQNYLVWSMCRSIYTIYQWASVFNMFRLPLVLLCGIHVLTYSTAHYHTLKGLRLYEYVYPLCIIVQGRKT